MFTTTKFKIDQFKMKTRWGVPFCVILFHTATVYNTVLNLNTQQNKFMSYKN